MPPTTESPGPLERFAAGVLTCHENDAEAAAQELVRRLLGPDAFSGAQGFDSRSTAEAIAVLLQLPDWMEDNVRSYAEGFAHATRSEQP